MIVREFYRTREEDGVNLYRIYSDESKDIRKVDTDEVYAEAIDVEGAPYTYEEIDTPIDVMDEENKGEEQE